MSEWNIIINITTLISLIFAIVIYKNRLHLFSLFTFYTLWYWIVMYSGIYIYYTLYLYFDFDVLNTEYVLLSVIYSSLAYALFYITYKLFTDRFKIRIFFKVSFLEIRTFGFILLSVTSLAVLVYIAINGGLVLLKSASYVERFESNFGLGGLTLFFPLFIPALVILFLTNPTLKKWRFYFVFGILIAILIFLAIGGARRLLAVYIFIFLIIGYHYKYIQLKAIAIVGVVAIPVLGLLASIRSSLDSDSNDTFQLLMFSMNSFSPFDSFVRTIEYYNNSNNTFEGMALFYNEFLSLVPRAFWPEKPLMMLNSANFYTTEILNYNEMLTISPTLNSSLYMIYGLPSLLIGSIIIGILLKIFDNSLYRNPFLLNFFEKNLYFLSKKGNIIIKKNGNTWLLHLTFYYYILFSLFTLTRESLEIFLIKVIFINIILFIFFLLLTKMILSLLRR